MYGIIIFVLLYGLLHTSRLGLYNFAISSLVMAVISHYVFGTSQLVGFTIPLLLSIPSSFNSLIRLTADVETVVVSADRVFHYCSLQLERAKLCQFFQISTSTGEIQS